MLVPSVAEGIIKPNRIGEPEAGQGTEGGRFTDKTDDSGPMKPGNRVEDKTLTTGKTRLSQECIGRRTRRKTMVRLILPYTDTVHCQVRAFQISSLECGKPWTKGDGDNIEEPN